MPETSRRVSCVTWDGVRYANVMQLEALLRDRVEDLRAVGKDEAADEMSIVADALGEAVSGRRR